MGRLREKRHYLAATFFGRRIHIRCEWPNIKEERRQIYIGQEDLHIALTQQWAILRLLAVAQQFFLQLVVQRNRLQVGTQV